MEYNNKQDYDQAVKNKVIFDSIVTTSFTDYRRKITTDATEIIKKEHNDFNSYSATKQQRLISDVIQKDDDVVLAMALYSISAHIKPTFKLIVN